MDHTRMTLLIEVTVDHMTLLIEVTVVELETQVTMMV